MDRECPLLLVEDDELDQRALQRALQENRVTNRLAIVDTAEDALAYLRNQPPFHPPERHPRPGLILLDLNLPGMSGLEFLRLYRKDPQLNTIPSVIITTSKEERDLVESYRLGVAGYIQKPVDFHQFIDAVRRFDLYWTLCNVPHPG